ncbi:FYVE-type zinc finger-containing protein [Colletotrichum orbiculare MAFF 240422]|uniref:FYVE-type zinc finger-containing protein n=1 Tax=Colletotrichum orbiculare (strain 104-T / ATCC 96160 / CBS 514.97 / LARS 414 / MAFF 240422) TaxID=1213857 RepID=A0A484FN09_COLOR|nr:FYVE-type zinc finger-containing protein [Colletotrichum orbiculare MAFF 240422]
MPRTPKVEDMDGEDLLCLRRANSSFINLPAFSVIGQKLTRRSTGDSGKVVDLELDPDLFPNVNGEPTRKHWKPDTESTMCDDPTCKRNFNTFTRRHHCRRCGNIFCGPHSANAIPLDEDCNYNPRGALSRACFHCFTEFKVWKSRNGSRSGSDQSSDTQSSTIPTSPMVASPVVPMAPGLLPPTKGPEKLHRTTGEHSNTYAGFLTLHQRYQRSPIRCNTDNNNTPLMDCAYACHHPLDPHKCETNTLRMLEERGDMAARSVCRSSATQTSGIGLVGV